MKKVLAILMVIIIISFSGCSKEKKFGVQQFTERMNEDFDTNYSTSEFMLSKKNNDNLLLCIRENNMITLTLDKDNNIKGISFLITADSSIEKAVNTYCQMCSVFTGNDYESQKKIFDEADFLSDNIKFTDSNSLITVGRYKYTVVCNEFAITMFCEKI